MHDAVVSWIATRTDCWAFPNRAMHNQADFLTVDKQIQHPSTSLLKKVVKATHFNLDKLYS